MAIPEILKKSGIKECVIRSARTFFQSAFGYIAINLMGLCGENDITKAAVEGLILSAVAAGIAAVMNLPAKSTAKDNEGGNGLE